MALTLTIWHNPRCSKSRQTLARLEENGHSPKVRLYLKEPPTVPELRSVLAAIGIEAFDLVRRGEAVFKELGLSGSTPEDDLLDAMSRHPILIERPIVIAGEKARIGRPPEAVLEIL